MRAIRIGLGLALALCSALVAIPATAVTYGEPDLGRHPNVGALVGVAPRDYPYCTGTLVDERVVLTVAHCGEQGERVQVTFDEVYSSSSPLLPGTFHADPRYPGPASDSGDLAVVVLDAPVVGIAPASLPEEGLLDRLHADGALTPETRFTSVGYGSREPRNAPGGKQLDYVDARWTSSGSFRALTDAWLRLSQNPATGDGGTCYGDSGGPNFLGAGADETSTIAGLTVTGDAWCRATNTTYRVDTPAARAFLAGFLELP